MNKKILSIVLCLFGIISIVIPIQITNHALEFNNDSVYLKREIKKDNNSYNVKVETYVKGEIRPVPTDVVILINTTKRMDTKDIIESEEYISFTGNNGAALREQDNLYAKVSGRYYKLSVTKSPNNSRILYSYIDDNESQQIISSYGKLGYIQDLLKVYKKTVITNKRLDKTKLVVQKIINDLKSECDNSSISHRVAVVGFCNEENTKIYRNNSSVKIEDLSKNNYKSAFYDIKTNDGYVKASNSLQSVEIENTEETRIDIATDVAKKIFKEQSNTNNKVLITISDYNYTTDNLEDLYLKDALKNINNLKSLQNFKSITVKINNDKTYVNDDNHEKMLNYLSSDFGQIQLITKHENKLNDKFSFNILNNEKCINISNNIKQKEKYPQKQMGEEVTLKEKVSDEFEIQDNSIKVYTSNLMENGDWSNKTQEQNILVKRDNNNLEFSNLNIKENCIVENETETSGKKIIIEYKIKVKSNYIDAGEVSTHRSGSGLYGIEDIIKQVNLNKVNIEPKSTEPQNTEPESTEPESTEPQNTEPESTEPESTEPQNTEPESTEPESTEPESTEPESTEPQNTEPESTEPESIELQNTEPQNTEPQNTEPESTEPESTEPESTELESTELENIESDNTQFETQQQSISEINEISQNKPIKNSLEIPNTSEKNNKKIIKTIPSDSKSNSIKKDIVNLNNKLRATKTVLLNKPKAKQLQRSINEYKKEKSKASHIIMILMLGVIFTPFVFKIIRYNSSLKYKALANQEL